MVVVSRCVGISIVAVYSVLMSCDRPKPQAPSLTIHPTPTVDAGPYEEEDSMATMRQDSTIAIVDSVVATKDADMVNVKRKEKSDRRLAKIVFDSLVYRLPPMVEGEKTSLQLRFVNEGKAPLEIREVNVACGCTTPEVPFLDTAPGEEGYIGVHYNSVGKQGLQQPEITVWTNGTPRKSILKLIVDVQPRQQVNPPNDQSIRQDTLSN